MAQVRLQNAGFEQSPQTRSSTFASYTSRTPPTIVVPPTTIYDQTRAPKTDLELATIYQQFIENPSSAIIRFEELQVAERTQLMRLLLPLNSTSQENAEPLLRLLRQHSSEPGDPLNGLVNALKARDIRFHSEMGQINIQTSVLNYITALFLQRWGLMTLGTAAQTQWNNIGQHYHNWNSMNRWPELLIVAPRETAFLTQLVLMNYGHTSPQDFQALLGAAFTQNVHMISRWWRVRRHADSLRYSEDGQGKRCNMIVPRLANWLQLISPGTVTTGMMLGEQIPITTNIYYASPDVYKTALETIVMLFGQTMSASD